MPVIPPRIGPRIGYNTNISTDSYKILSNVDVVDPTGAGEQVRIVSTSDSDTLAGTGIQKVRVVYFDNNWSLEEEVVSMNGISSVDTAATNIYRIQSFEAFQAGSNIYAVGTITAKSTDGARLFAQIDSGNTTFTMASYYISPGKRGNISDIVANCPSFAGVLFQLFVTKDNTASGGGLVRMPCISFVLSNDTVELCLQVPVTVDASSSTQGLQVGIAVKGLAAAQIGMASFNVVES